MNLHPDVEHVFPLSGGSFERPTLRPPRIFAHPRQTVGPVMTHRAFVRAWAARRAARLAAESAKTPAATSGPPELCPAPIN